MQTEIERILLKEQFDPLLDDGAESQDRGAALTREQLYKLFSDDIEHFNHSQQAFNDCHTYLAELGYNDGLADQFHDTAEQEKPRVQGGVLSDLDVFYQAFDATIEFLAQNSQNEHAVQTLRAIHDYF